MDARKTRVHASKEDLSKLREFAIRQATRDMEKCPDIRDTMVAGLIERLPATELVQFVTTLGI